MNELANTNENPLAPILDHENPYDEFFKDVSGSQFLPRVQLFISNSDAVKEEKIDQNHYGFVSGKDNIIDLGKEVDVLILSWRPRSLDTSDRNNIRSSCNPKSETFLDIKEKSQNKGSACQFGPEYLLWVKDHGFATFFMGGKSSRNEAPKVHKLYTNKQAATLKSRLLTNPEYKWFSPAIFPCSTPFPGPTDSEELEKIRYDFLHPVEQPGAEIVKEEVNQRDR